MNEAEFLLWVRGPGLATAAVLFVFGWVVRLFEVYALGRQPDLAPPREHSPGSGWRTVWSRSFTAKTLLKHSGVTILCGYTFHAGLFVTLFLFVPHIELFRELFGFGWPGLPSPVVDVVAVITLLALLAVLLFRVIDPVKRYLSTVGDYWGWLMTFLPVVTGWMTVHQLLLPYTTMLALHILSVELLLIAIPFSKLGHMVTLFTSRWYNGESFGRKGVAS